MRGFYLDDYWRKPATNKIRQRRIHRRCYFWFVGEWNGTYLLDGETIRAGDAPSRKVDSN